MLITKAWQNIFARYIIIMSFGCLTLISSISLGYYHLLHNSLTNASTLFYNASKSDFLASDYYAATKKIHTFENLGFTSITYVQNSYQVFELKKYERFSFLPVQFHVTVEIPVIKVIGEKKPHGLLVFKRELSKEISLFIVMCSVSLFFLFLLSLRFKTRLLRQLKSEQEKRHLEHLSTLSTQVAHDIRSPLAALDSIYQDLDQIDTARTNLIKAALSRIHAIADGLLTSARTGDYQVLPLRPISLTALIDEIVAEKKVQFSKYPELSFSTTFPSTDTMVSASHTELSRILSNLINNSAEAMNYSGTISLSLSETDNQLCLAVTDQGPGIPPSIVESLGSKGNTLGKANGNGLGLYHAHTQMKKMSGEMQILSTSSGTTINLIFPKSTTYLLNKKMVLVDNDPLVRMNWSIAAKKQNIELMAYPRSNDLLEALPLIDPNTPIYLDDDLGEEIRGIDLAQKLHLLGFKNLHLCTGHDVSHFKDSNFLQSIHGKDFPQINI